MRHRALHHPRALYHLRQKHLALPEQITHHVHARHQRAFNHVQGSPALDQHLLVGLFSVLGDEIGDAVHQRVAQTLRHFYGCLRGAAPGQFLAVVPGGALGLIGNVQQALARGKQRLARLEGRGSVQHHVFHPLAQGGIKVIVHAHHAGVDDAHVHTRLNGVVQKHGVDGLAHRVVAAKAERHIAHATAHLGAGQVMFDPAGGFYKVHRVVVVLLDAGGNGKNIRVEDDVLGRKVHLVHQDAVGPLANFSLAGIGVGLA